MVMLTSDNVIQYLCAKDPIFCDLKNRYGLISHELHDDLFSSIVFHIVEQMLSVNVGRTIYKRLEDLCGGTVTENTILTLSREQIRNCGIAYSKVDYILLFAKQYSEGTFDFNKVKLMQDEEVIAYLTTIKGVGTWTAEMIAQFSLGRENIFSYNDVALRNGIMKAKRYKTLSKKRFESLRKKYSPYCSYAAFYYYAVNDDKEFNVCTD